MLALSLAPAGAHGHGNASETVGPISINGRDVSLEISSSATDPDLAEDKQISVSLLDHETKVTLRDVTLAIRAERGSDLLFDRQFEAEHGFVVFNFVSGDDPITVTEEEGSNFFASLLGFDSRLVHVTGDGLAAGGLYKFKVDVLGIDGMPLAEPAGFEAGVSIPQTTRHHVGDPNYGPQYIDIITYYDGISGFAYDPYAREITYEMPFEWDEGNINQTLVVHQEFAVPETFGDLLASGFVMHVNGIRLSDGVVAVDDFAAGSRIVHFTIFQQELLDLMRQAGGDGMSFSIRPDRDHIHQSAVTGNGQFRIYASTGGLESGKDARIEFDVTDVFLRGAPISAGYELEVSQGDTIIHRQSGTSTGSEESDTAEFRVPAGTAGIVSLSMVLDGNERATVEIPMAVDRAEPVPDHVRAAAQLWARGDGGSGFEEAAAGIAGAGFDAPSWLKHAAGAWASGEIGDAEFLAILEFLADRSP